jgi:hypothetical protein
LTKLKLFIIILSLVVIIISIPQRYYNLAPVTIKNTVPVGIKSILRVIRDNKKSSNRLNNDYNIKFLPNTEFVNLDYKKLKTNIKNSYKYDNGWESFYIDTHEDNLFLFYKNGKSYYTKINEINDSRLNIKKIKNNLKNVLVLDVLINNTKIYVTASLKMDEDCNKFTVYESSLNFKNINFTKIFQDNNCYGGIQAGKIGYRSKDNSIFVSTSAEIHKIGKILRKNNEKDKKPQDINSLMGKIIKINLDNYDYEIYSLGHRNILGMYVNKDVVLVTENGPRGGDEINLIKKNRNYGWPISSYGDKDKSFDQVPYYKKSHEDYGFEEPIYSFIPSIGISEIIKLEKNFTKQWGGVII